MTDSGDGKGRPPQGDGPHPQHADLHDTTPLSPIEEFELADLRRRAGRDNSRWTWLDLQVGDSFVDLGEQCDVVHVGALSRDRSGGFTRPVVVLARGRYYRTEYARARGRLHDAVVPATPERAAWARALWAVHVTASRAELAQLRAELAA